MANSKLAASDLTEALLAKIVALYLKARGWDLYPEVVLSWFNGRPDYIGMKDSLVMAVECKKTLSYEVIEQLYKWRHLNKDAQIADSVKGIPHLLVAASFVTKGSKLPELKAQMLKSNRFGYLTVRHEYESWRDLAEGDIIHSYENQMSIVHDGHVWRVAEAVTAKIQPGSRLTASRVASQLDPDMKRATAGLSGKSGGNYSTPFRRTLMKAVAVLETRGSCHLQTIVDDINKLHGGHHLSTDASAKQSISKFLREFQIAEAANGYPEFRLLPDYKSKIYSSETQTQRAIREQKAARLAAKKTAPKPAFWERLNLNEN